MNRKISIGRCICIALLVGSGFAFGTGLGWAAPFDLILCGSGGEPQYQTRFADWGMRLKRVLVEDHAHHVDNVRLLTESGENADGNSDLETIRSVFEVFGQTMQPTDDLFVVLVGHGSYRQRVAKLNIPGPDLSAADLDAWLHGLPAQRTVVINGASASAAFINVLSGRGRIVCTSTKSVEERYATQFMEYFIQALEEDSADQNRDGRISVLEACQQAASLTDAWYLSEGLIATEHALLDDNGDGLGSRLSTDLGRRASQTPIEDGEQAAACFLRDYQFPAGASAQQVDAYQAALQEVEQLIQRKADTKSDAYYRELEVLLIRAARLHRQIRAGTVLE